MSLSAEWFVEFDKETLDSKMQSVNFGVYAPAEKEISPNDLNRLGLSHVEFESILMKHFVSQLNVMHNFLNTEAIANDDPSFQRYARKMLNYTKAELSYCYHFWQNEKYLDHIIYRLNATLLRTYFFLLDIHKNVVRRKTLENRSYWSMNESLEELAQYLAVRLEDLVCLIQYFENSYETLYTRIEHFSRIYPLEVDLVAAICIVSNQFIGYSYEELKRSGNNRFSQEAENKLKQTVFTSNRSFREKHVKKEKNDHDMEKDARNYLLGEMVKSRIINQLGEEIDKDSSMMALKRPSTIRENKIKYEPDAQSMDSMLKSNYLERLKESQKNPSIKKKLLESRTDSSFDSHGLSSVSSMKFSTLSLSSLSSVKESPNNPLAKSALMNNFISDMGEEHDLRIKIAKESKMITRQNIISHFNKDILYKNMVSEDSSMKKSKENTLNMSVETDQKRAMYGRHDEDDEYVKLVKSGLVEELYMSLIGERNGGEEANEEAEKKKNQPRTLFNKLKLMNRLKTMIPVEKKEDKKKRKKKNKKKAGHEHNDEDEDKGKKNKLSKKRQREEDLLKTAAEIVMSDQLNYQPSKENKGDEVDDDEALGGLKTEDDETVITEEDDEDEEDKESSEGHKDGDENEDKDDQEDKHSEGADSENQKDDSDDSKDSKEHDSKNKKKRERMLKTLAEAQQNVSTNEFHKDFEELLRQEQKNLRSRYFLPRRNFFEMSEGIDINLSRHKSKWSFLQDNYHFQNVEKMCYAIKNGETQIISSNFLDMISNFRKKEAVHQDPGTIVDRSCFRQKTRKMKRDLSKPFQFAKQNGMVVFQDIFGIIPVEPIIDAKEEEKKQTETKEKMKALGKNQVKFI